MQGILTPPFSSSSSPSAEVLSALKHSAPSGIGPSAYCRTNSKEPFNSDHKSSGQPAIDPDGPLPSSCVIPGLQKHQEFHQQLPIDLGGSGMSGLGYGITGVSQLRLHSDISDYDRCRGYWVVGMPSEDLQNNTEDEELENRGGIGEAGEMAENVQSDETGHTTGAGGPRVTPNRVQGDGAVSPIEGVLKVLSDTTTASVRIKTPDHPVGHLQGVNLDTDTMSSSDKHSGSNANEASKYIHHGTQTDTCSSTFAGYILRENARKRHVDHSVGHLQTANLDINIMESSDKDSGSDANQASKYINRGTQTDAFSSKVAEYILRENARKRHIGCGLGSKQEV